MLCLSLVTFSPNNYVTVIATLHLIMLACVETSIIISHTHARLSLSLSIIIASRCQLQHKEIFMVKSSRLALFSLLSPKNPRAHRPRFHIFSLLLKKFLQESENDEESTWKAIKWISSVTSATNRAVKEARRRSKAITFTHFSLSLSMLKRSFSCCGFCFVLILNFGIESDEFYYIFCRIFEAFCSIFVAFLKIWIFIVNFLNLFLKNDFL